MSLRHLLSRVFAGFVLGPVACMTAWPQAAPVVREGVGAPLTMEELRQRLSERVAQAQAGQTRSGVPHVNLSVKPKAGSSRHRAAAPAAAAPSSHEAHAHQAAHWGYEGPEGPQAWARLDAEFATCATGTRQSPIDIRDGFKVELQPIEFDYQPTAFSVIDNGHTVQVDLSEGSAVVVSQRRYELKQFHFHRPSEERIDGRQFEMVVHLVHRDGEGRLAVLAVLIEQGRQHPAVQTVWNNLPLEKHQSQPGPGRFDPGQLLPTDRRYFTYMGSLTTPPCTEGVLWLVLKQPVGLAPEQIALFSRLYPMNARPTQPGQGRMIKESN